MSEKSNADSISVNKYISSTGYCSRREADEIIKQGRVTINGLKAKLGNRVSEGDSVLLDGKEMKPEEIDSVYILLNKPRGIVCTTDSSEPDNIVSYINYPERIFPIGRLDKPSQGLILLTNNGDIVNKILRAGNKHEKEYVVTVNKSINDEFIRKMRGGIPVLGTITDECKVDKLNKKMFRITLTQGLNRQIRRMCDYLGYKVKKLERRRIMHLTDRNLPYGEWRHLSDSELTELKNQVADSSKTG